MLLAAHHLPYTARMAASFKVVALGVRGSGKTVYFAILHHLLRNKQIADGLAIKVQPPVVRNRFEDLYQRIADPTRPWPEATVRGSIDEWTFSFVVNARGKSFPIMNIEYVDYAGELLASVTADDAVREDLTQRIHSAHALLVIVDGQQLFGLLSGQLSEDRFYRDNIEPVIPALLECAGPIHLVISKWDLIDGRFTLNDCRKRLLSLQESWLRDQLRVRREGRNGHSAARGLMRLIPVSSVGAFVKPEGSFMQRQAGMTPAPQNILVPFLAIAPDLAWSALNQWQSDRQASRRSSSADAQASSTTAFSFMSLAVSHHFLAAVAGSAVGGTAATWKFFFKHRVPIGVFLTRFREPRLRSVRRARSAYQYAVKSIVHKLREYDDDFPDSRLI